MTQSEAIDKMLSGANVFLTGEPGAGKTYTLNKYIQRAKTQGKRIAITASTGIAASHIDGVTVHSWSGIGIRESLSQNDVNRILLNDDITNRYNRCDVLVIDEISMLHGKLLNMIDTLARHTRSSSRPFGGIQVIFVGDMFQLPPVTKGGAPVDFVHESSSWREANLQIAYLTEQHRQGADSELLTILRQMRASELTTESRRRLSERLLPAPRDDSVTRLYTHNIDVDALNEAMLDKLPGRLVVSTMYTAGDYKKVVSLKRNLLVPEELKLKVGAEVMFCANNFNAGYVNGTRGRVIDFSGGKPLVETVDGVVIAVELYTWRSYNENHIEVASATHYPLRLAWAVTVHKSQGLSLDAAVIDLSRAFTPGMGYVALSRVRSLEGLYLSGMNEKALKVNQQISEYDKKLER